MRERFALAAGDTFRSMRTRNFRLFFVGQFVSQVGNWLTLIAQTLLVLELTDRSGVAVGFLVACQFAPVLLIGAWAGLVADRSDKRRLLLVVQAFAMVQSFVLAAVAFLHAPIGAVYIVAFFGGLATAFDNPARRAFVVELVPESDVQNAVSLNSALMTSARIFGPALAGLLVVTAGFGWAFAADGLSYVAVLVGLWMIDPTKVRSGPVTERGKGQVRAGLRYVRQVPVLWISLVMMAIVGTITFNFGVTFPLFVLRTMHGDNTSFTILYSITSVGSLIGALSTARRRTVELRDVVRATALYGVAMVGLSFAPNLGIAYALAILVGFTSIAFMTTATAIVQLRADPVMRGRVLALQAMVFLGSTPIGGPILGFVCDTFGPRSGLLLGAVAALGAAAWGGLRMRRRVRSEPALDASQIGVVSVAGSTS
jgi:MFS family permease